MIEDAAHAHGAMVNNIKAGSIGDFGCFSFYSTKIMTSGEGGMITMNNESSYKKCSSYRNRGIDVDNKNGELFINLGSNHRMTEFQAILCRSQLSRLPEFLSHRNQIANAYIKILSADGNHFRFQEYDETTYHSYWRFIVFLDKKIDRQKVQLEMSKKNIVIDAPYLPLLHKQPIFESSIDLPCVESYSSHHVSLPIHSLISIKDATYIAKNLLELIK
jgi:perosamine synthetase